MHRLIASLTIVCALAAACSAGPSNAISPTGLNGEISTGLPSVAFLDALHSVSASQQQVIDPLSCIDGRDILPAGPGLDFDAQQSTPAWAVYRISPSGTPLSITASGTGSLWIVMADYGTGRWERATALSGGQASGDFTTLSIWESPGRFAYVAVVCPQTLSGHLDSLVLSYNGPASVYYVDTPGNGGDDANPGTSEAPWATLQHAADTVGPDSQVIVRPGQYDGFMLQTSGTADGPITFTAQGDVEIISDNSYTHLDGINIENWGDGGGIHDVVIEGFTVNNRSRTGIRIAGTPESFAHNVVIRDCHMDANGTWGILSGHVDDLTVEDCVCTHSGEQHGIYLSNSGDRNIARGNLCYGNNDCGIQFNADLSQGGDGIMSEALIENNICYDNGHTGGAALNLDGVADSTIRNNLLYGNHAGGLVMYSGDGGPATDNVAVNNTIVMADDGRWCVNIGNGSTGNTVENNILLSFHSYHGSITIDDSSMGGFVSDYNVTCDRFDVNDTTTITLAAWQLQTGQDLHSVIADPGDVFADAPGNDWHLKDGSPALDMGTLLNLPQFDLDGVARPQGDGPDAGCYELPAPIG
jgi:parallel beta-helix repeat protein